MSSVCFHIKPESSLEEAWEELSAAGFELLYSSEDANGNKEIYACVDHEPLVGQFIHISNAIPADLDFIDWESQWALHGADYRAGYVHADLGSFGEIRLRPGPGFGDLSHATTKLILQMMSGHIKGKNVLDIGSGSGILSLAAVAMGAKSVWGIDIDPQAIRHSQENLQVNGMEGKAHFGFADDYTNAKIQGPVIALINMIESEQIEALSSLKRIEPSEVFASGILQEDRERYLQFTASQHWELVEEQALDGWLGFHFTKFGVR